MKISRVLFLYEGRTNSVFRDPFCAMTSAFRRQGVECDSLDLRHVSDDEVISHVTYFRPDVIFQVSRVCETCWRVARMVGEFGVPTILWNLEEPNSTAYHDTLLLPQYFSLYVTLDARMTKCHNKPVMYLPLFFDDEIYYERRLPRNIGCAFLIQMSTPRLRKYIRPLIAIMEDRNDSFVSTYRPMKNWKGASYRLLASALDRSPLAFALLTSLVMQRTGRWKQAKKIKPNSFFVNRDEEEKAFIYGRAKVGLGFSRVFGPWETLLERKVPNYERDEHGNCVQLKSRHFEIAGAGAMLLSDASPDLDKLFEPNTEYIPFDYTSPTDFKEKLTYFLTHDTERERIAAAGYKRACAEHTLTKRVLYLLDDWGKRW